MKPKLCIDCKWITGQKEITDAGRALGGGYCDYPDAPHSLVDGRPIHPCVSQRSPDSSNYPNETTAWRMYDERNYTKGEWSLNYACPGFWQLTRPDGSKTTGEFRDYFGEIGQNKKWADQEIEKWERAKILDSVCGPEAKWFEPKEAE